MDEIANAILAGIIEAVEEAKTGGKWKHFQLCLEFDAKDELTTFEVRNLIVRDMPKKAPGEMTH